MRDVISEAIHDYVLVHVAVVALCTATSFGLVALLINDGSIWRAGVIVGIVIFLASRRKMNASSDSQD